MPLTRRFVKEGFASKSRDHQTTRENSQRARRCCPEDNLLLTKPSTKVRKDDEQEKGVLRLLGNSLRIACVGDDRGPRRRKGLRQR